MNGLQIYQRALTLTHTNTADYDTDQANEDMELIYQELVDEITNVTKGDYFWDKGDTDTVIGQSEYVVQKLGIAPEDLDIKKINKVFIKYSSDDEFYTQAVYQNPGTLPRHPDYYMVNQPKNLPFFYIQDNSFFIYPAPTEVIADGIEIFVIHKPEAISVDTAEDNIEIPTQFHKLITDGMRTMIFDGQGKTNEAQVAQQKYEKGVAEMVAFMKARYNQPIMRTTTNLCSFR